ncbi:MAG: T9SS type A sorting domain-containing protein [Bacteroidota bacterium]
MKKGLLPLLIILSFCQTYAQDWEGVPIPANPGAGKIWQLRAEVSDDFNYESVATSAVDTIGGKWTNFYHNGWTGPAPTFWKRENVSVADGKMQIRSSRVAGDSMNLAGQKVAKTYLGCVTSTQRVQYPVYIETRVKIMKSVLASDVWLLSADDTQEIDICEAYGSSRWHNPWFSNKRLHLSHHVFIRNPFTDWQPSDEGSFYTDGTTIWSDGFHRIGVYWRDPWHLEYYVDGRLVRTRSGKAQIDPVYHTNATNQGDPTHDTRTGLSKPMDIIINTEDQTWRAKQGLTPTAEEMGNSQNNTFQVDWVRVYKPVDAPKPSGGFGVYPNPSTETLNIVGEPLRDSYALEIINPLGQKLPISGLEDHYDSISLDVSSLLPGYYSLRLITDEEVFTASFFKE